MPTLQQIGQNTATAAAITMNSSAQQSMYQVSNVAEQANGTEVQLQLQSFFEKINTDVDNVMTAAKNANALAAKSLEMYTLVAQTREKIMQTFNQINQQRGNNAWANIKNLASGFKL
jgi:chlorite dismutase